MAQMFPGLANSFVWLETQLFGVLTITGLQATVEDTKQLQYLDIATKKNLPRKP